MSVPSTRRARALLLAMAASLCALLAGLAGPARALAEAPPRWKLEARSAPTNLPANGQEGLLLATAVNFGGSKVYGAPTITDKLPAGMEATNVEVRSVGDLLSEGNISEKEGVKFRKLFSCSGTGTSTVTCAFEKQHLPPAEQLELVISVRVPNASALEADPKNELDVAGGETAGKEPVASPPPLVTPLQVTGVKQEEAEPFGIEHFEQTPENEDGSVDTQAGSHPYQLTTVFDLDETLKQEPKTGHETELVPTPSVSALEKTLHFQLPPGLIGNPNAVAQCNGTEFSEPNSVHEGIDVCPSDTALGVAYVTFDDPSLLHYYARLVPVFNLVPAPGEPARFGFDIEGVPIVLRTSLRSGSDYGVNVTVEYASQAVQVLSSRVTIWGTPDSPSHDEERGWDCLGFPPCKRLEDANPEPFLSLPSGVTSRLRSEVSGEAWSGQKITTGEANTTYELPSSLENREGLEFDPSLSVYPVEDHEQGWSAGEQQEEEEGREPASAVTSASTPTGLRVHVHVPQTTADGRAESSVRTTTVALPPEMLLNASAANGLEACSEAESGSYTQEGRTVRGGVGYTGQGTEIEPGAGGYLFTSTLPEPLEPGSNFCPNGSKVGTVRIKTPDLPIRRLSNGEMSKQELTGGVYLATQYANPFGSLFAMYIVAEEKESGVLVKLPGRIEVSESGQVSTTFENTPDVPFEDLRMELFGGPRGSLSTPAQCGPHTTTSTFTPWSGGPAATPSSTFGITSGPGGSACPSGALPFGPSFSAGSTEAQAGAYSPFTLTISKPDGQQSLKSIDVTLPAGVAAKIASVTPCANPLSIPTLSESEPPCGPESEIGTTTSVSGLGGDPVTLPGKLYLTKGFDGAPFGLLASTKAEAGPFDLGWVNVLSTISVNEETAVVTTRTVNPIPQFIKGVPASLKSITVSVSRPGFEFNPTNCSKLETTGELGGWENTSDAVSYPFYASKCGALGFRPEFTVSTSGKVSKEDGASLKVKVAYPKGAYANIAKTVTDLPYDLPSRLKPTIQHACPDYDFNPNNLSTCDEDSLVGEGVVHTPVFKNPLTGPAYLVSHANRSFPDIYIVLTEHESGVKIVLDGHTDIKNGITKTSFESVPDAPVETFELTLPEGPHSALFYNGNLCDETKTITKREKVKEKVKGKTKYVYKNVKQTVPEALIMPTTLTAQNGAVIQQETPITVEGCPKAAVKSSKTKKPKPKPKKKKKKK